MHTLVLTKFVLGSHSNTPTQFDKAIDEHIAKVSTVLNDNANELGPEFVAREKAGFADFKKICKYKMTISLRLTKI